MKNTIPIIIAVILALAAVFAVSRIRGSQNASNEDLIEIVAAARDLIAKENIKEG